MAGQPACVEKTTLPQEHDASRGGGQRTSKRKGVRRPPCTVSEPHGSCPGAGGLRSGGVLLCPTSPKGEPSARQPYRTAFGWPSCLTSPAPTQAPGEGNSAALWTLSCNCAASRGRGRFRGQPPRREHTPCTGAVQPWLSGCHRARGQAALGRGGGAVLGEEEGALSGGRRPAERPRPGAPPPHPPVQLCPLLPRRWDQRPARDH